MQISLEKTGPAYARWQRVLLVSGVVGLALLNGGCNAPTGATNNSASTPAVQAASGEAKIDPQAKQLWHQAIDTYKRLNSYAAKFEFTTGATRLQGDMAWAKPNRMRLALRFPQGAGLAVSDGKTLYGTVTAAKGLYVKAAAPPDLEAAQEALQRRGVLMNFNLDPILWGKNPEDLFAAKVQSLALGAPDTINGVAVDTVELGLDQQPPLTLQYAIGHQDHLVYRIAASIQGRPQTSQATTFTDVKANPPLPNLALNFTPPLKAEAVDSLLPQNFDRHLLVGKKPFPLRAKDIAGKPVSLDQYKGKVLLLDFWATWCGPCMAEMPDVVATYKKFKRQDFDIVGFSLDDNPGDLNIFLKLHEMPWRQVCEGRKWESTVPHLYGVSAIPFTLLVGRDGRIVAFNLPGGELEAAVRQAVVKPS